MRNTPDAVASRMSGMSSMPVKAELAVLVQLEPEANPERRKPTVRTGKPVRRPVEMEQTVPAVMVKTLRIMEVTRRLDRTTRVMVMIRM